MRYQEFDEKRETMIRQKIEWAEAFVNDNLKFFPDADKNVLSFIADFMYWGVPEVSLKDSAESIRSTFRVGFCYYFALMLRVAFCRGTVCWAAPFSHIVWVDDNNIPYDIEGVNCSECDYYIPIEYLGESISSFKHVPGVNVVVEDADVVIARYKEDLHL